MVEGDFEWDADKAKSNERKHGVSFREALTVFADPRVGFLDDGSGAGPQWAIGLSHRARLLRIVHEERGARVRIISAQLASTSDALDYTEGE